MSRQRFVSFDGDSAEAPLFSFPYDDEAKEVAETSLEYLHGKHRHRRTGAMSRLVRMKRYRSRSPVRSLLLPKKHRGK
jgi:hypothetical protein